MDRARLVEEIKLDEGCRLSAYQDDQGVWTIGWGHTGKSVGSGLVWSRKMADTMLHNDIEIAVGALDHALPWWRDLDVVRQNVLADMCFNLGITRLLKFQHMLAALEAHDFARAADEMRNSYWAKQVGDRETRLERMMRSGQF
jgi:lysozyme